MKSGFHAKRYSGRMFLVLMPLALLCSGTVRAQSIQVLTVTIGLATLAPAVALGTRYDLSSEADADNSDGLGIAVAGLQLGTGIVFAMCDQLLPTVPMWEMFSIVIPVIVADTIVMGRHDGLRFQA